ncbi:c-type cytochrome [Aurantivibrio plasticivorans]
MPHTILKIAVYNALMLLTSSAIATGNNDDPALALTGNVKSGSKIYSTICKGCHGVSIAPTLRGVIGRTVASEPNYPNYSDAIKAKQPMTWSKENISRFLIAPQKFIPGTQMVQIIDDPQKRADIVAFLEILPPPRK